MSFLVLLLLIVSFALGICFLQNKIIFFPEVLPSEFQFEFHEDFEEIFYETKDGISINALHFKAKSSKGIVFYSHGNAGSLRTWGSIAGDFLSNDYDLLIYDYRSYGKSEGKLSEEKLYEDAETIYGELAKKYNEENIVIYGRSIGTGIASKVAVGKNPGHLVLESPYYNFPDLAKRYFPLIPSRLIKYKLRNDVHIQQVTCPVTLFHGTSDEVIYYGSSLKLEKHLGHRGQLVTIPGGHHNDLPESDVYRRALSEILR